MVVRFRPAALLAVLSRGSNPLGVGAPEVQARGEMAMNIDEMYDAYNQVTRGFVLKAVVIAYPEGTWLLRPDEEPRLLGEEKDFESIMCGVLGIKPV